MQLRRRSRRLIRVHWVSGVAHTHTHAYTVYYTHTHIHMCTWLKIYRVHTHIQPAMPTLFSHSILPTFCMSCSVTLGEFTTDPQNLNPPCIYYTHNLALA